MSTLEQNQHLFELASDSVMIRAMDGTIDFWNRGAEALYGWKKEEAAGKVSHSLLKTQFPKPLEEIEFELVRKGQWEGQLVHTTRDGSRVAVRSRWTLDVEGQSGAVFEINAPATEPATHIDAHATRAGTEETSKSMQAGRLPARIANGILAGGGVFCLFLLFQAFYYYGWTAQRSFTSPAGLFVYFVLPALMAIALFASLRLAVSWRVNVALCIASVAFTTYTIEASMTLWFSLPSVINAQNLQKRSALAKRLGIAFDGRSKAEVIDDLNRNGIDAVPSISPQMLLIKRDTGGDESVIRLNGTEVLPLASIANKVTVVCNEGGQYLTYTSDEHGFNNPPDLWKTGAMDIVALGDSFVQGWCVPPKDNFVALIRKRYPATLNLGIEGDGPLTMLATMAEFGKRLSPKVVLWFYFEGNDIADLRQERQSPLLNRYLTGKFSQGLPARQPEIDRALIDYIKTVKDKNILLSKLGEISTLVTNPARLPNGIQGLIKLSELRKRLGLPQGREGNSIGVPDVASSDDKRAQSVKVLMDSLHEILLEAKTSISAWGGELYFIYLPSRYRYDTTGPGPQPDRDRVLQVATRVGVPIIDIHPIFKAQADPMSLFPLRIEGHYNEEGHRLVADAVLRAISVDR